VPVFEISSSCNGKETVTTFITLYRNSPEGGIAGWLAWRELEKKRDRAIFCIKANENAAFYVPVVHYGCPEEIISSAILSKADLLEFVGSLFTGKNDARFVRRYMDDVYKRDDPA
jgi:hypothetical protein